MNFKENLKFIRLKKGLTQAELGSKSNLKPCAISHFETGERTPNIKNLKNLCLALECSADELILK